MRPQRSYANFKREEMEKYCATKSKAIVWYFERVHLKMRVFDGTAENSFERDTERRDNLAHSLECHFLQTVYENSSAGAIVRDMISSAVDWNWLADWLLELKPETLKIEWKERES